MNHLSKALNPDRDFVICVSFFTNLKFPSVWLPFLNVACNFPFQKSLAFIGQKLFIWGDSQFLTVKISIHKNYLKMVKIKIYHSIRISYTAVPLFYPVEKDLKNFLVSTLMTHKVIHNNSPDHSGPVMPRSQFYVPG